MPPTGKTLKITDAAINDVFDTWCRDLTADAAENPVTLLAQLEEEALAVIRSLARMKHNSVCITGEAGNGKSTALAVVAQYIANGKDLPKGLHGARIILVDLDHMNAGAKFRGQLEERLKTLFDGLAEREGCLDGRKVILAFDSLSSLMGAGMSQGGTSPANMIKPFLVSKGISVLAAATPQDYQRLIGKDPALARRFEEVTLGSHEQRVISKAETLAEIFIKGAAQPVRIMPVIVYRRTPLVNNFTA